MFDWAIFETGDGGDILIKGGDIAVINSIENMAYLGMFGGNIEQSTKNNVVTEQSFDYWGNTLLMNSNLSIQFNSIVEKTLINTPLTSRGRQTIEDAIKKDLQFIIDMGIDVSIDVQIAATDRISIEIRQLFPTQTRVTILDFRKQTTDGDFSLFDFNEDFY